MIILEKGTPVSLTKTAETFGEIAVNLNWTQNIKESGLFNLGGLFGSNKEIDLDLGCFVELKNGKKFALQPLGEQYGNLTEAPFVRHSGDDRTGGDEAGENLNINGTNWNDIKRILVYTYIYEGSPTWDKTDAKVTINCPGQDDIVIEMGNQSSSKKCCALAHIENDDGNIRVSKEMEFFNSQQPMDVNYGYGFSWRAGKK